MDDWKEIGPFWSLSDTFTVHEAAALIAGFDPNAVDASGQYFKNIETGLTDSNGIAIVVTVLAALTKAVNAGTLKATIRRDAWQRGYDEEPSNGERFAESGVTLQDGADHKVAMALLRRRAVIYKVEPNWSKTTIDREDLIAWLRSNRHSTGFFFPDAVGNAPDCLNDAPLLEKLRDAETRAVAAEAKLKQQGEVIDTTAQLRNEVAELQATAARLEAEKKQAETEIAKGMSRTTMLKLIGGMARLQNVPIHGTRINGLTALINELASVSVSVSENTLRGLLQHAAQHIEPPSN